MRIVGIIPARYASTRLPGKPLKLIGDTSLIMRVYNQCKRSSLLENVYVATDDKRIESHVLENGGKTVMTNSTHESGTERCNEAFNKIASNFDYAINIQGDEPFIDPVQIDQLCSSCDGNVEIATLFKKISTTNELLDVNVPKVVLGEGGRAVYFSRSPVPNLRGVELGQWIDTKDFYKHIGIYAYRKDILATIANMDSSMIERMEQLEQLRWLSNGISIHAIETNIESISVDTEKDLQMAISYLNESKARNNR